MKRLLTVLCLSVLFAAGAVFAQPEGGPSGGGRGGMGGMGGGKGMMMRHHGGMMMGMGIGMLLRHKDDLKLTADQVSKLQKMRSDAMKDGIKRQADLRSTMVDVADSLTKQPPDFNAARQNMKKASDMKAAAKTAMIDNFEKAYNVLTKEQKDMLPTMMQACCAADMDEGDEEE